MAENEKGVSFEEVRDLSESAHRANKRIKTEFVGQYDVLVGGSGTPVFARFVHSFYSTYPESEQYMVQLDTTESIASDTDIVVPGTVLGEVELRPSSHLATDFRLYREYARDDPLLSQTLNTPFIEGLGRFGADNDLNARELYNFMEFCGGYTDAPITDTELDLLRSIGSESHAGVPDAFKNIVKAMIREKRTSSTHPADKGFCTVQTVYDLEGHATEVGVTHKQFTERWDIRYEQRDTWRFFNDEQAGFTTQYKNPMISAAAQPYLPWFNKQQSDRQASEAARKVVHGMPKANEGEKVQGRNFLQSIVDFYQER